MAKRTAVAGLAGLVAVALLVAACSESVGPKQPELVVVGGQQNGTLNESGTTLIKGFNPTNPHHGDAIVVTFFWIGSATISSVTDVLTLPGYPVVGNTYNLVDYVTAGGVSMATYVATNVQGFPDAYSAPIQDSILAVRATLSAPVVDGGIVMKSYSGVFPIYAQALGGHGQASGSGSTYPTVADPGAVTVGAGSLAYGVSMSSALVGADKPVGWTNVSTMSDSWMVVDGEELVPATTGPVHPTWNWYFNSPSTWLGSVLTLNEAVTKLAFTVQPSTSLPCPVTMPPVEVTAEDDLGSTVSTYNGTVTIAIAHNAGALTAGTLSGTLTVPAVNGVARFSNLCIDQPNLPGNGYTLQAAVPVLNLRVVSSPFNIGAF